MHACMIVPLPSRSASWTDMAAEPCPRPGALAQALRRREALSGNGPGPPHDSNVQRALLAMRSCDPATPGSWRYRRR